MLDFSRLGKPIDDAFIEPFNGRLRAKRVNARWFLSLADAREKLEAWCRYDNEDRPNGAIGRNISCAFINFGGDIGQLPW